MLHRLAGRMLLGCLVLLAPSAARAQSPSVSYAAGGRDAAGRFMGGTELRNLVGFQGRLYAGNGYWMDRPEAEGLQPAEVLALDGPGAGWRVDHQLEGRLPNGRPRHLAVSALTGAGFATSRDGQPLPRPLSLLLAGSWDLSGLSQVFVRDGATGTWTATTLPAPRLASGIQQVRALAAHRDRVTGADLVFAGNDPHGIFSGGIDASGALAWNPAPELDLARLGAPAFPGLTLPRVMAMAECGGSLYAALGQQIYRRIDGATPRWELLYTNPKPGYSESGLRGLTAIPAPSEPGQVLLATVEGTAGRVVRIDPASGQESGELDVPAFLGRAWGTRVGYTISGYNDVALVHAADGEEALIGLEAFIPATAPIPAGHARFEGLDAGGWYLVRHPDASYELRELAASQPATGQPLVSVRTIAPSPFAGDGGAAYFGGFDANKRPAHDTAWIMRVAGGG